MGYSHHGIYLGGNKVAQFGGRISDKPGACIGIVSLAEFESGGRSQKVEALVVDRWSSLYLHQPGPPDEVVGRALWLVENYPAGRYNLLGNNCETMAIWCRSGGSTESRQTRGAIDVIKLLMIALFFYFDRLRERRGWSAARVGRAQVTVLILRLIPTFVWSWHRYKFARFITREHPPTRELLEQERVGAGGGEIGRAHV